MTRTAMSVPQSIYGNVIHASGSRWDQLEGGQVCVNFEQDGSEVTAVVIPLQGPVRRMPLSELVFVGSVMKYNLVHVNQLDQIIIELV